MKMRKIVFILIGIFSLFVLGVGAIFTLMLFFGKADQEPTTSFEVRFRKGVSFSPQNALAVAGFWEKSKEVGEAVRGGDDWQKLGDAGTSSRAVAESAPDYDLVPVIEVNFFDQNTGELLHPLSAANRDAYQAKAVEFAQKYQPPYFGIGVEIDTFYRKNPKEFDNFVTLFNSAYDAIKEASPHTRVFTTFQLERMRGLRGGIFGGTNETSKNNWSLPDKFSKADLIAFTTYPGLIYKDPADIPSDYYAAIRKYTSKPIAFTEVGWSSSDGIRGWESSEAEQKKFVERFFSLTSEVGDIELAIWIHLYQQSTAEPFGEMALYRAAGTPKPAWGAWVSAKR
jgi:hypothetical protein